MMAWDVPPGTSAAASTVRAPSGSSRSSRFSMGIRAMATMVSRITAAAIRLAALKKSR
ncbi:hypothetical protein D3C84_1242910 [compost metagenome]